MSKKGDMLGTIGKWVIGAVAVLIILTIFVRGFYKEIFDVGLKFAEKVKPVEKYQEGDSSGEEEELRRIQERFLQDISGKSGRECLVPYRLGELGDRMLEFSKSSMIHFSVTLSGHTYLILPHFPGVVLLSWGRLVAV